MHLEILLQKLHSYSEFVTSFKTTIFNHVGRKAPNWKLLTQLQQYPAPSHFLKQPKRASVS